MERKQLSKFLSYILRHAPAAYGLQLDENGYAALSQVFTVLKKRFKYFKQDDLHALIENDPKGRFEVRGNKIRATYGHSIKVTPGSKSIVPPEVLFHGTSVESAERILVQGLQPMGRQFVHLSGSRDDAYMVGRRHTNNPLILTILAQEAAQSGIQFFKEGSVFLVKSLPKEFIQLI